MEPCDINKVESVNALLRIPPPERQDEWTAQFLSTVVDASFACGSPQVFIGPDGFPYFALHSPEPFKPFDSFCLCNLAASGVEQGFGAAINPSQASADWVFSYGDLLTYHLFGSLRVEGQPAPGSLPERETLKASESVLVGQPSESYLPAVTRSHIRRYLEERAGVSAPGVLLMVRPQDNQPQQLVFSVYRRDQPSDDVFRTILQGISWFLPRHYVVVGLDEPKPGLSDFEAL
jgi:hypothetical protein